MPYKYKDLKWSEMTDKQQKRAGSKSEHKAAKQKAQAKAQQKNSSPPPSSTTSSESSNNRGNALSDIRGVSFDNAETIAPGASSPSAKVADQALNTKYSEMSDEYKATTNKADHKEARKAAGTYTNNRLESYNVDNIEDFDPTKTGIGYKDGENRLNKREIKNLKDKGGFSEQEIYDYATTGGAADAARGKKAQALLDSYKSQLTPEPEQIPEPKGPISPPPEPEQIPEPKEPISPPPASNLNPIPEGLDPELAKKALGGENWGPQDQKRYDDLVAQRDSPAPAQSISTNQDNTQVQTIKQDTDINSKVVGDNNATNINQDNTAINTGGNQDNISDASNSNQSGAQDFLNDRVTAITDNIGNDGTTGNLNTQDTNVTQDNTQVQTIKQDNDIDSAVTGNSNTTIINQDNLASNIGGDQTNSFNIEEVGQRLPVNPPNVDSTNPSLPPSQKPVEPGPNPQEFLNEKIGEIKTDENQNSGYADGYGGFLDLPPGSATIQNFIDSDGDGVDDRNQTGPGQPNSRDYPSFTGKNDKPTMPGKSQDFLDKKIGDMGTVKDKPRQDLTNPNTFTQDNTQVQTAKQDNDINSEITGNNNFTKINQDNSVRNYGGDQRNFTYVSNRDNPSTETPASMATLSGYYSVSDSPASNASFVDQYQTMNRDSQKKYSNVGMAQEMIRRGNSISPLNMDAFEDSIYRRSEIARARGLTGLTNVFGDYSNLPQLDWQSPPPREPLPDFDPEELYNTFT